VRLYGDRHGNKGLFYLLQIVESSLPMGSDRAWTPLYRFFVQHTPVLLNPVGHSVDQLFTVPLAVQGHERLHSSTYNRADVFLFHDFRKRAGAAMIFGCRSTCQ
jgi:hypothetical protein